MSLPVPKQVAKMVAEGRSYSCPMCGNGTGVYDSRPGDFGIRRRRACRSCGHRFTTVEHELTDAPQGYLEMLAKLKLGLDTVQSAVTALQVQTKSYADAASFLHDVKYGAAAKPQEKT